MLFVMRVLVSLLLLFAILVVIVSASFQLLPDQGHVAFTQADGYATSRIILLDIRTQMQLDLSSLASNGDVRGRNPLWSPDGKRLIFTTYLNRDELRVFEMEMGQWQLRDLTTQWGLQLAPSYSTDGRVALVLPQGAGGVLYLVDDAQATELESVINNPIIGAPQWSPDGAYLAFQARNLAQSDAQLTEDNTTQSEEIDLFTFHLQSANLVNHTQNTPVSGEPIWSPDSQSLVFTAGQGTSGRIFLLDVNGSRLEPITPANDRDPVWSPDGCCIAFVSLRDGNREVYTMDMATRETRNISQHPSYDIQPSWSPDGKNLIFVSRRAGQDNLFIVNLADDSIQQITVGNYYAGEPHWQPTLR